VSAFAGELRKRARNLVRGVGKKMQNHYAARRLLFVIDATVMPAPTGLSDDDFNVVAQVACPPALAGQDGLRLNGPPCSSPHSAAMDGKPQQCFSP